MSVCRFHFLGVTPAITVTSTTDLDIVTEAEGRIGAFRDSSGLTSELETLYPRYQRLFRTGSLGYNTFLS